MILTLKEFAEKYKVTRQTLYKWIDLGMPTEINVTRITRLDEEKTLKWIDENIGKADR